MPTDNATATAKKSTSPSRLSDQELLTRIRKRVALMLEGDRHNRDKAREDMRFLHVPGEQWDPTVKKARGDRPCYEFNKARIKAKRIVNEMRANRPAGKVRAVEESDKKTAEVMEGLGRNILQVSDFDTISDQAGEYQVGAGIGAWRIVTEYAEDSFDQDIKVVPVSNPFNLYWGPESVEPLHRDAPDWALLDWLSNDAYTDRFGKKARKVNFDSDTQFDDDAEWKTDQGTRVCEYHWKEPYEKHLLQLADGKVIDAASDAGKLILAGLATDAAGQPLVVKRERKAVCQRILMCTASGDAIIEGPVELKGRYHRFIVVHGEWLVIDGKPTWCGITRYAKDAQRAYNVASTAVTEAIATAPNSHYWVTVEQAKGNTTQWNKAVAENLPWLLYNPDPKAPGAPQRVGGADVPSALIAEQNIRDQELKDVMGVYDTSLGDRSNETSGRAISRRNEQGQIVNFNFPDNMAKGKQWTVTIVNDLIPFYYDTERTVRVIGVDGAEDYVKINTAGLDPHTGEPVLLNDLTRGKYDTTVTVGPSFATQRQEAAEAYTGLAAQDPLLMTTAGDVVYQSLDLPYADQIAERRRAMLPPEIQAILSKGKEESPEMARARAMLERGKAQLDQQSQLIQQAAGELEQKQADVEKANSELKVTRAQFDADIAKENAQLSEREAGLVLKEAQFIARTAQPEAPKRRLVRVRRENGELIGESMDVPSDQVAGGMQ